MNVLFARTLATSQSPDLSHFINHSECPLKCLNGGTVNLQECVCTCPSGWRGMDCSGKLHEVGSTAWRTVDSHIIIKGVVYLSEKKKQKDRRKTEVAMEAVKLKACCPTIFICVSTKVQLWKWILDKEGDLKTGLNIQVNEVIESYYFESVKTYWYRQKINRSTRTHVQKCRSVQNR